MWVNLSALICVTEYDESILLQVFRSCTIQSHIRSPDLTRTGLNDCQRFLIFRLSHCFCETISWCVILREYIFLKFTFALWVNHLRVWPLFIIPDPCGMSLFFQKVDCKHCAIFC